jgi:hypothetical protein
MAGLSLNMGGVVSAPQPSYGQPSSYAPTATQAAFGPGATMAAPGSALSPADPVGMAVYLGVAAVIALVLIRRTLPN